MPDPFDEVLLLFNFLPLFLLPAWSTVRLVAGVRSGSWQRPGWFAGVVGTALYLAGLVWLRGSMVGGLDVEATCGFSHHQPYDRAYSDAHVQIFGLPPLSHPCNDTYDMVPGWVNPTLVVLLLTVLLALAGLVWTAVRPGPRRAQDNPAAGPVGR